MTDNNDQVKAKIEGWVTKNKDYAIKQAEMLQAVITRMANNSLEVKKFGLAVWSAIVVVGLDKPNRWLFLLALFTFILFGMLDIYYLYQERKFRDNFNRLTRIINGSIKTGDEQWISEGNFLRPDYSTSKFWGQIPKLLTSWANLPYLFTSLITIVLWFVPLP